MPRNGPELRLRLARCLIHNPQSVLSVWPATNSLKSSAKRSQRRAGARRLVKDEGPDAGVELDAAEECMRRSGLWPWA